MVDPLFGQRLGRYEIRGLLGRGGMSRVYRALDHNLQREIALKVLDDRLLQGTDFVERFEREAHTLAALRHPGIVPIYDYGNEGGVTYIAEQLLTGSTLEEDLVRLKAQGRRMDRAAVLQVVNQLADALDYAHGRGVIHRDLKPSNVIRNARGDLLLTDFGIAVNLTNTLRHTQTGQVLGTPAYLSPEQAQGSSALGPASDVYALGVMLYEMLTGRVPFENTQPMAVALAHVQQPPPSPRSQRPDLPPAVEQVVLRALAKDPGARYPSAGALAQALAAAWVAAPPMQPAAPAALPGIHDQATVINQQPPPLPPVQPVSSPTRPSPVTLPVTRPPTSTSPRTPAAATPPGRPPSQRGPWIALGVVVLVLAVVGIGLANILRRNNTDDPPAPPTAVLVVPTTTDTPPTPAPTDAPPTPVPTDAPATAMPPTPVPPTEVPPTPVPPTEPPVPPTRTAPPLPTALPITPPTGGAVIPLPAQIFDMRDVIDQAEGQQMTHDIARQLRDGLQKVSDDIQASNRGAAHEEVAKLNKIVDDNGGNGGIKSQVAQRLKQLLQSLDEQIGPTF